MFNFLKDGRIAIILCSLYLLFQKINLEASDIGFFIAFGFLLELFQLSLNVYHKGIFPEHAQNKWIYKFFAAIIVISSIALIGLTFIYAWSKFFR